MADTINYYDGTQWQGLDLRSATFYGECSTASSTAIKVVTIAGFTSANLVAGARVSVRFTTTNTSTAPTLNVSSTGAKMIRYAGSTSFSTGNYTLWQTYTGLVIEFVYTGTYWEIVGITPRVMTNTEVTSGTSTTPKLVSAAQLKLAAETHSSSGGGGWLLYTTMTSSGSVSFYEEGSYKVVVTDSTGVNNTGNMVYLYCDNLGTVILNGSGIWLGDVTYFSSQGFTRVVGISSNKDNTGSPNASVDKVSWYPPGYGEISIYFSRNTTAQCKVYFMPNG